MSETADYKATTCMRWFPDETGKQRYQQWWCSPESRTGMPEEGNGEWRDIPLSELEQLRALVDEVVKEAPHSSDCATNGQIAYPCDCFIRDWLARTKAIRGKE